MKEEITIKDIFPILSSFLIVICIYVCLTIKLDQEYENYKRQVKYSESKIEVMKTVPNGFKHFDYAIMVNAEKDLAIEYNTETHKYMLFKGWSNGISNLTKLGEADTLEELTTNFKL